MKIINSPDDFGLTFFQVNIWVNPLLYAANKDFRRGYYKLLGLKYEDNSVAASG